MKIEAFTHSRRRVFSHSVSVSQEIHQPKLHGHWHEQPPTAALRVWGASALGSLYGACIALLCPFGGHRGAQRKIFPKHCTQAAQTDPAAAVNGFCLAHLLPSTPVLSVSTTASTASLKVQATSLSSPRPALPLWPLQTGKWDQTEQFLV